MQKQKLHITPPILENPANSPKLMITEGDLCPLTADLCGILMPCSDSATGSTLKEESSQKRLILTPSASKTLRDIALAISLKMPILLYGPTGCGKTSLIEEAARKLSQTGNVKAFLKVNNLHF